MASDTGCPCGIGVDWTVRPSERTSATVTATSPVLFRFVRSGISSRISSKFDRQSRRTG